jgi:hypothetical protein
MAFSHVQERDISANQEKLVEKFKMAEALVSMNS